MCALPGNRQLSRGPKRKEKHYAYDESVDEPAQLLENEPVDIERAVLAEENDPVETICRCGA